MPVMSMDSSFSEVAILSRAIHRDKTPLPPEAARALLAMDLAPEDQERMRALSTKAAEGKLSTDERAELASYTRVSHILAVLHSKARHALS